MECPFLHFDPKCVYLRDLHDNTIEKSDYPTEVRYCDQISVNPGNSDALCYQAMEMLMKIRSDVTCQGSLNEISDIINSTNYSMSKYKKIKGIVKKRNHSSVG